MNFTIPQKKKYQIFYRQKKIKNVFAEVKKNTHRCKVKVIIFVVLLRIDDSETERKNGLFIIRPRIIAVSKITEIFAKKS